MFFSKKNKNKNDFVKRIEEDKMEHMLPDGSFPVGWFYKNRDFTDKVQNEHRYFLDSLVAARKDRISAERAALKSLVLYLDDLERICKIKGECFVEWASMYFESKQMYMDELRNIEENFSELIAKESMLKKLRIDLLEIIKSEQGVIQSSIYKRFDESLKNHISNELYQMETHEIITREKSGRSYKLFIKNGG